LVRNAKENPAVCGRHRYAEHTYHWPDSTKPPHQEIAQTVRDVEPSRLLSAADRTSVGGSRPCAAGFTTARVLGVYLERGVIIQKLVEAQCCAKTYALCCDNLPI